MDFHQIWEPLQYLITRWFLYSKLWLPEESGYGSDPAGQMILLV